MQRIICNKTYDTETATLVKKVTFSFFGDPKGYEECLFVTESGHYFLYVNGGAESKHVKEKIVRKSKTTANAWLRENA